MFAQVQLHADPKESKSAIAADLVGHIAMPRGGSFVVHVGAFTKDDAANAIALKGRVGSSNTIRAALGTLASASR